MVDVIKDDRTWKIQMSSINSCCPHLYYPANYHGCRLVPDHKHDNDKGRCTLENCPLKVNVHVCPECGKTFADFKEAERHINDCIAGNDEKRYQNGQ